MGLILLNVIPDDKRPWVALLVGMAAIAFVMFKPKRRLGFSSGAGRRDPLESPSSFGSLAQQRSVDRQMQNLLVELSEMSRQISGQLDTRAAKLEVLIREADEKLEQLRRAGASTAGGPAGSSQRAADFRVGQQQSFVFASPSVAAPAPAPATGPRLSMTYTPDPDEPDPRHAEIYRLAAQGRNAKEIAATLGRPSGEIELILALRPRRAS